MPEGSDGRSSYHRAAMASEASFHRSPKAHFRRIGQKNPVCLPLEWSSPKSVKSPRTQGVRKRGETPSFSGVQTSSKLHPKQLDPSGQTVPLGFFWVKTGLRALKHEQVSPCSKANLGCLAVERRKHPKSDCGSGQAAWPDESSLPKPSTFNFHILERGRNPESMSICAVRISTPTLGLGHC